MAINRWAKSNISNKIALKSNEDYPRTGYTDIFFWFYDPDLDPMTLIYQLDLTIVGMYMRIKNELSRLKLF